jgi:hypothetical protein
MNVEKWVIEGEIAIFRPSAQLLIDPTNVFRITTWRSRDAKILSVARNSPKAIYRAQILCPINFPSRKFMKMTIFETQQHHQYSFNSIETSSVDVKLREVYGDITFYNNGGVLTMLQRSEVLGHRNCALETTG